jgi:protein TonB
MQSMAISLADSLGRTARGDQELAQAQHGLSVAQRKLLGQLGSPGTLEILARDNGWDSNYASKTATRLVELGLVTATAAPRAHEEPVPEGGARVLPLSRGAPRLSRPWPAAVAVVLIAGAVVIWWSVSSNSSSSVEKIASLPSPPAAPSLPNVTGPAAVASDGKGTVLPKAVFSMTLQQAPTPAPAPEAKLAPAPVVAAKPAVAVPAPAVAAKPAVAIPVPAVAAKPAVVTRGLNVAPAAREQVPAPAPAEVAAPAPAAPEAKTVLAAAAPELAKPTASTVVEKALKIIQREAPSFPREALLANVSAGSVKARLSVDGGGNVTKVEILEAQPRRIFDREVQRTLMRWKFEATGQTQTAETEVVFNRE